MSNPGSSLPDAWVERIWATMRATYGAAFDRLWACPAGVAPEKHVADLKAVWGRELRFLQQNPQAIAHALDHLPEQPPNLVQFKALCVRAPEMAPKALPSPKADPAKVAEIVGVLRRTQVRDPKDWARRLRDIELHHGGVMPVNPLRPLSEPHRRMTPAQRQMWRAALEFEMADAERTVEMPS